MSQVQKSLETAIGEGAHAHDELQLHDMAFRRPGKAGCACDPFPEGVHFVAASDYVFPHDWPASYLLRSTGYLDSSRYCTSAETATECPFFMISPVHVACLATPPLRTPPQEGPTPSSWPSNLGSRFEMSAHFSLPSTRPEIAAQISSSPPRTCSVESRSRSVKVLSLTDWNYRRSVSSWIGKGLQSVHRRVAQCTRALRQCRGTLTSMVMPKGVPSSSLRE